MQNSTDSGSMVGDRFPLNWKVLVVTASIFGLVSSHFYLARRVSRLEALEAELARVREATASEIEKVRSAAQARDNSARRTIRDLNEQITGHANSYRFTASQAKANAEKAAQRAEQMVRNLAEQAKAQQDQVAHQIGEVRQTAEASETKVGEVISEVGAVKSQVDATRSTLDHTLAELKSMKGDQGVQSGLIATNAQELRALRTLGERSYHEFKLTRSQPMLRVAGIAVGFRKSDPKAFKFSLDIVVQDKRIEKKDRSLNEPVQFYVNGSRLPYEIVVNEIQKDSITGYLSTPKVIQARR